MGQTLTHEVRHHVGSRPSEKRVHDFRLLEALITLPGEAANLELLPRYRCDECGHDFDVPKDRDLSDQKGPYHVDICPNCGKGEPFSQNDTTLREMQPISSA